MKKINQREHGQVIILLAAGIISLLGFTALAIDGARLFSERRNVQGVADTAAFTGAAYLGKHTLEEVVTGWGGQNGIDQYAETAALERIRSNGYTDALYNPFGGNDRLRITVNPYPEGTSLSNARRFYVEIRMISDVDPVFAQVLYDGPLNVYVESEAIVMPAQPANFGYAMYSMSNDECDALKFSGNADISILGSGIFSNSECGDEAISFEGSSTTVVTEDISSAGGINIASGTVEDENGNTPPMNSVPQQEAPLVPEIDCSDLPLRAAPSPVADGVLYYPGRYPGGLQIVDGNSTQTFLPGLYCFTDRLKVTNGNIYAHDVMFYFENGGVEITGGYFDMIAPRNGEADFGGNSWNGMLIYMEYSNDDTIDINANSYDADTDTGNYFEGTIYAPGPPYNPNLPKCSFTGNGDLVGYDMSLMCYSIELIGGAGLEIEYTGNNVYEPPVSIDLVE